MDQSKRKTIKLITTTLAIVAPLVTHMTAVAQTWPSKPITLIVPFPAGGLTDILGRHLARDMENELGQPVVVENRAGASGQIGAAVLARAPRDGYTLMVTATHHVVSPAFKKNLPYDATKNFTNIAMLASAPNVLAVNRSLGIKSIKDFINYSKEHDGGISFGSTGTGSATHLTGELIRVSTGADMTHIPYSGGAPAITDFLGGTLQALAIDLPTLVPYLDKNEMQIVATTAKARQALIPNVPTMAESGYPGVEAYTWIGFFGPQDLSKDLSDRLHTIAIKSMNSPESQKSLASKGTTPGSMSQSDFDSFVIEEIVKWKKVVVDTKVDINN